MVDNKLCEVDLSLPSQLRLADQEAAPVLVEVWLKLKREEFATDTGRRHLKYAFKTATLHIETKGCRIDPQSRLETVVHRMVEKRSEEGERITEHEGEANIGLDLSKILSAIDASLSARAELRDTVKQTRQSEQEIVREYRSVWSSGKSTWCLVGLKNEEGIITDRICGDEPVCAIIDESETAQIRARVTVDLRDLWVEFDDDDTSEDVAPRQPAVSANKRAVCHAIVARGKPDPHSVNALRGTGEVELARATVQKRKRSA